MTITLLELITVAILAVLLSVAVNMYSKESPLFYVSILIVSFLLFIRSGDILIFLTTFLSSITVLLLYTRRFYVPFALLFAVSLLEIYYGSVYQLSLSISLGALISLLMSSRMVEYTGHNETGKGISESVELKRDLFHAGTGIIAIVLLELLGTRVGESVVLVLMLLLYLLGNFAYLNRSSNISKALFSMEREKVNLGIGSLILAIGVLLVFGLVSSPEVILMAMFLVLIADPLATIAGTVLGGHALPYNRNKTYSGFGVALAASVLFAVFAGGTLLLIYAVVGTLVESATRKPFDDNLTVPVSIVALNYLLKLI